MRYLNSVLFIIFLLAISTMANATDDIQDNNDRIDNTKLTLIDLDPPELSHAPANEQIQGTMPFFSVVAADKQGLENVTLLHRTSRQTDYSSVKMTSVAGSNQYVATIDKPLESVLIEYYFIAVDIGGNRVLNGAPYQPYTVSYRPYSVAAKTKTIPEPKPTDNRLKWTVIGAIAVAVLLASNQSSDSQDTTLNPGNGPGNSPGTVPVTVTIPAP